MVQRVVIAGGGIGGLAAAPAAAEVLLLERASAFGEASIQRRPYVTLILHE